MPSGRGDVRSRRSAARLPVTAVTGAAGVVGTALLGPLVRTGGAERVIALDVERGPVDGPTWRIGPLDTPEVVERLRGAEVVVHVAQDATAASGAGDGRARRERAVRSVQAVATASAALGVRRLVVVTSAMVLGARADTPVPLTDGAPPAAPLDDGLVGDLLEVELVLATAARVHPATRVTVVRPAALVGPGVDTVVTRHFEAPRLLALRGQPMRWQFCHLDDLASAVALVVERDLDGVAPSGSTPPGAGGAPALTVAATGSLGAEEVERLSGMRRVEVPAAMAFATAERLHRVGVLPSPAGDLAYVVHPWVVAADGLRAAGWVPSRSNEECLATLLDGVRGRHAVAGRRLGRRDAAMGAAGAAVAVIGTAALVRKARGRR